MLYRSLGDGVVAEGVEVDVRQRADYVDGPRALDGAEGHRQGTVVQDRLEASQPLDEGALVQLDFPAEAIRAWPAARPVGK